MNTNTEYNIKTFYKDQIIFKEGDASNTAYLIKIGCVNIFKVIDNKRVVLSNLKAGQIFGEMSAVSEKFRTASAMAAEYTDLIVIDQQAVDEYMKKSPVIIQSLVRSLINRLKATNEMISIEPSTNVFLSICHIINLMNLEYINSKSDSAWKQKDGLNYMELSGKIKEILSINQFEIDTVIKKLSSLSLVEAPDPTKSSCKYVKVLDPKNFISLAKKFYKEFEANLVGILNTQEYMDIYDFAKTVDTTPELIYKKIGAGEIPENIFCIHSAAATEWIKEVGVEFFKKVKRRRIKIEDIEDINDVIWVDNARIQEVFSSMGHYKIGVLIAIAGDEARKKMFGNLSSNVANIIKEEMPSPEALDEIEIQDIENEFISRIKKAKSGGEAI